MPAFQLIHHSPDGSDGIYATDGSCIVSARVLGWARFWSLCHADDALIERVAREFLAEEA